MVEIHDIVEIREMRRIEALQQEVWGIVERDIVPVNQMVAAVKVGGILLGAFDGPDLIGFAYGFVGVEGGRLLLHSHMVGVREDRRNREVGLLLKLAQRERAIERGYRWISWTFDPLLSRNAWFNFSKLGVTGEKYLVNFYGEEPSSSLHRGGTDRLLVCWHLEASPIEPPARAESLTILKIDEHLHPRRLAIRPEAKALAIEIPGGGYDPPGMISEWRLATREAFQSALEAGYIVAGFAPTDDGGWRYSLIRPAPQQSKPRSEQPAADATDSRGA